MKVIFLILSCLILVQKSFSNELAGRIANVSIDEGEAARAVVGEKRLWLSIQERRSEHSEEWISIPLVYFFKPALGAQVLRALADNQNSRYDLTLICADADCRQAEIQVADNENHEVSRIKYQYTQLSSLTLLYELNHEELTQASQDEKEIARLLSLGQPSMAELSRFDIDEEATVLSVRIIYGSCGAEETLWLRSKRSWLSYSADVFVGSSGNFENHPAGQKFEGSFEPLQNGFSAQFSHSALKRIDLNF